MDAMVFGKIYDDLETRVKEVLKENGEVVEPSEESAKKLLYCFKWKDKIELEDLYCFAKDYNCSLDYLMGLKDDNYI